MESSGSRPNRRNKGKPNDETKRKIGEEAIAFVEAANDPVIMEALQARRALELQIESQARGQAIENERKRQEREQAKVSREHLEESRDRRTIIKNVVENVQVVADQQPDSEQVQKLNSVIEERQSLTLALGVDAATRLKSCGIKPDTKVQAQHVTMAKKFSKRELRLQGKFRKEIPEISHKHEIIGWTLPISGQIDNACKVILCEDGRILTAYGIFEEKGKANPLNSLTIKPNYIWVPKEDDVRKGPDHIYYSYLTADPMSDIGMANTPIDNPVSRASIIAERQNAMQDAVVGLLVEHPITINENFVNPPAA